MKLSRVRVPWLRYSLRTALIAVTLLCIVLGTWASRSLRQRDALAALKAAHEDTSFEWHYDYEVDENGESRSGDPPGPAWLRDWLGIDFFANVATLELDLAVVDLWRVRDFPALRTLSLSDGHAGITDDDLAPLAELHDLKRLDISLLPITGEGLAQLARRSSLREFSLSYCANVTDAGIATIGNITSLRKLDIRDCPQVSNAGLRELRRLTQLEELHVRFGNRHQIDDGWLDAVAAMPRLRSLAVWFGDRKAGDGLRHLADCGRLESLELFGNRGLTDSALAHLPALPMLKRLYLNRCERLTDEGLGVLVRLPKLETLFVSGKSQMSDGAVRHLQEAPALETVIFDPPLTDAGIELLLACPQLRRLSLINCGAITDEGLPKLAQLSNLRELYIASVSDAGPSENAVARLRKMLPGCVIGSNVKKPP